MSHALAAYLIGIYAAAWITWVYVEIAFPYRSLPYREDGGVSPRKTRVD